ncbi:MAG: hypothetical protein PF961_00185 [Planctomycetota bacterium]|nr:hypothetical protein [Planctomycetota bacterium]
MTHQLFDINKSTSGENETEHNADRGRLTPPSRAPYDTQERDNHLKHTLTIDPRPLLSQFVNCSIDIAATARGSAEPSAGAPARVVLTIASQRTVALRRTRAVDEQQADILICERLTDGRWNQQRTRMTKWGIAA